MPPTSGVLDSDFGGDTNEYKSTSDFLAMLKSGSYEHVLDWHSRKQAAVSRSSCESEFIALGQASAELLWLCGLLTELKLLTTSTTVLTVPDCCRQGSLGFVISETTH